MVSFVRANLVSVVIFAGVILGLILPEIGSIWSPYLKELLMLLMLFASLRITVPEFRRSMRVNIRAVLVSLMLVFLFMPMLSLTARFFSPIILAGTVLAFNFPSAIATIFWSGVFRGHVSL